MDLELIWQEADGDVNCFIATADSNGYGLWSIQEFLNNKGINMSEDEIDCVRCPYLYN